MRKTLLILLLLGQTVFANTALPSLRHESETLFMRRILALCNDGDFFLVQDQITSFLDNNPNSLYKEHFFALLGDIALHEKKAFEALEIYDQISNQEILACIQVKRFQALYELGMYTQVYEEIKPCIETITDQGKFYFAEAAFRIGKTQEALVLFNSLSEGISPFSEQAAYLRLKILADNQQWRNIALNRTLWITKSRPNELAQTYFYLAASHFKQQDYKQAILDIECALKEHLPHTKEYIALKIGLICATELKNLALCERWHALLIARYPEKQIEGDYLLALAYKKSEEVEKALTLFDHLLHAHPNEEIYREKIELLLEHEKWNIAYQTITESLEHFPYKKDLQKLAINLSLELSNYDRVIEDLEKMAPYHNQELLFKIYLKINRIQAALTLLHQIKHPDLSLHLHLIKAYLQCGQKIEAAHHLDMVMSTYSLSLDHRLQLAKLYQKAGKNNQALELLRALQASQSLETEPIHLEAALDEVQLLASLQPPEQRNISHLHSLIKIQKTYNQNAYKKRQLPPQKAAIYQTYMLYLQACIYDLESKLSKKSKIRLQKKQAAYAIFSHLSKQELNNYLNNRLHTPYIEPELILVRTDPLTLERASYEHTFDIPAFTLNIDKTPFRFPVKIASFPLYASDPEVVTSTHFDVRVEYAPKYFRPGYVFKIIFTTHKADTIKRIKQNIFFLIDRSNSIPRARYALNKQLVSEALDHLHQDDTFNIFIFDRHITKCAPSPLYVNSETLDYARDFLDKQNHGGHFAATELYASLDKIIPKTVVDQEVNTAILFSDGDTYLSQEKQRQLIGKWTEQNKGKICLYSVASGTGNNLPLLKMISSFNQGALVYAYDHKRLHELIPKLLQTIQSPIGKQIKATAIPSKKGATVLLQPQAICLPELYQHRPLVIYGSTNRLSDFVLFLQGEHHDQPIDIKKIISFDEATKGSFAIEQKWTELVVHEFYARYLEDGNLGHLEAAKNLLSPVNIPTPWID